MLTHLLTEPDCDTLRAAMLDHASQSTGPAHAAWCAAVELLDQTRLESFQRRAKLTPTLSQRRKNLGLRYSR